MMTKSKIIKTGYSAFLSVAMGAFSRYPIGTNVYNLDWDVLILLDTCRVDALKEVAEEYHFLSNNTIGSITSVGSTSSEWIANTFTEKHKEEIAQTAYVSANAYTTKVLRDREFPDNDCTFKLSNWQTVDAEALLDLDEPWKYRPETVHGFTRPRYVTDRAIENARKYNPKRLVVHYSQPHEPYTAKADEEGRDTLHSYESNPFEYLKQNGDYEEVWGAYLDNLRMGLDDVKLLLNNIDAGTVAISADHGEAFGEYGIYRHPAGVPHPKVKQVPWVETTAKSSGNYQPTFERDDESNKRDLDEHLKNLGYL